jgi:hypothetical protein
MGPQPGGYFARLPNEILLEILEPLNVLDFTSLVPALYPLLRARNLAPTILPVEARKMMSLRRVWEWDSTVGNTRPRTTTWRWVSSVAMSVPVFVTTIRSLPPELILHMSDYMSTQDKINFAIATLEWGL